MVQHTFKMELKWDDGRNGSGVLQATKLRSEISIPQEMGGPGIGTNPDEMLLGAAATCYLITFATLLENSGIKVERLSMQAEGIVDVTNGVFTYEKILHKPHVLLETATEREKERVMRIAKKAEQTCMISKALKGNVSIECSVNIEQVR
ncbi:hypothetical protein AEA09_01695 [Lysinibacillus contaminans]|uniref:Peroxiredoxin n=1 Tax=Lysinibacillus contaminans TaxID=1293441 RepID=A0ABR5K5S6_9BACI|nr:SACOL1771 family peroxiredoxin [Lysinibacillus contaminans]KOS71721.1 hypothetical protein AEA09_01695 [Lysinibacillus contaminans]